MFCILVCSSLHGTIYTNSCSVRYIKGTMKLLISLFLIENVALGQHTRTRDITAEVDVYASLRPFSLKDCITQCIQRPKCNSILLEEKTKTCLLNRNIANTSLVWIRGYKYSEKPYSTKQKSVQQCLAVKKEWEKCNKNGTQYSMTPSNTKMTTTTPGSTTPAKATSGTTSKTTQGKTIASTTPTGATKTSEASATAPTSSIIDTTTAASVTVQQPCPTNYLAIFKFDPPICYRIEMIPANFYDAESQCQAEGSKLILPDSRERLKAINEAVFDAAIGTTTTHMVWMDASRRQGTWKTSEDYHFNFNDFLNSHWSVNQTDTGNCVSMLFTPPRNMSGWLATNCSAQAWYICTPTTDDYKNYPQYK